MSSVLVIDDEAGIRDVLKEILVDEGYEVFTGEDGIEGLQIVKSERVDLVILDVWLPNMGGIDVLKELKALRPELEVIIKFEVIVKFKFVVEFEVIFGKAELRVFDLFVRRVQPIDSFREIVFHGGGKVFEVFFVVFLNSFFHLKIVVSELQILVVPGDLQNVVALTEGYYSLFEVVVINGDLDLVIHLVIVEG